jgi:predicted DCC family thiol-disulfide oxidoreductase YuxK
VNQTLRPTNSPVLLYDGVCGVCNSAVRTILRFDRRGTLRFAALDSEFARSVIERHPGLAGVDSAVYVRNAGEPGETVDVRSTALLRVAGYLGGWWRLAQVGFVVPRTIRDRLYEGFASVRYRIGGRHETCPIPTAETRARFLDSAYG